MWCVVELAQANQNKGTGRVFPSVDDFDSVEHGYSVLSSGLL